MAGGTKPAFGQRAIDHLDRVAHVLAFGAPFAIAACLLPGGNSERVRPARNFPKVASCGRFLLSLGPSCHRIASRDEHEVDHLIVKVDLGVEHIREQKGVEIHPDVCNRRV